MSWILTCVHVIILGKCVRLGPDWNWPLTKHHHRHHHHLFAATMTLKSKHRQWEHNRAGVQSNANYLVLTVAPKRSSPVICHIAGERMRLISWLMILACVERETESHVSRYLLEVSRVAPFRVVLTLNSIECTYAYLPAICNGVYPLICSNFCIISTGWLKMPDIKLQGMTNIVHAMAWKRWKTERSSLQSNQAIAVQW